MLFQLMMMLWVCFWCFGALCASDVGLFGEHVFGVVMIDDDANWCVFDTLCAIVGHYVRYIFVFLMSFGSFGSLASTRRTDP